MEKVQVVVKLTDCYRRVSNCYMEKVQVVVKLTDCYASTESWLSSSLIFILCQKV